MKKLFSVAFKGCALGGEAIIFAETKEEAIQLCISHPDYPNERSVDTISSDLDVEELPLDGVAWIWDGGY